tara:strand:+ start:475 stop:672 length:198 start_codon:yes stop_codon:yes gene_type:complete
MKTKKIPGGNTLIKNTATQQRLVAINLKKASKFLNKAGNHLLKTYKLKINYSKKNKSKKNKSKRY